VSLGDRIRTAREAAGLTREELAARAGVSPRTLGNWERGTVAPRSKLGAIERVLAVRLREGSPDQDAVTLTAATDAEVLANLAQRLAERDRRISELQQQLEEAQIPRQGSGRPNRWAARSRDSDEGRQAW
jgi:transcriptional regulator with XRE-family HTH domain